MISAHANLPQTNGQQAKVGAKTYEFDSSLTAWVLGAAIAGEFTAISPTTFSDSDTVTITGTGLTGATGVNFNDQPAASFTVVDDQTITCSPAAVLSDTDTMISVQLASGAYLVAPELCLQTGGAYDADAQATIDEINLNGNVTLTVAQEVAINNRILAFKADGLWANIYAYYGFIGGTEEAHSVDWKNPGGSNNLTWTGSVTHDSNGITGAGGRANLPFHVTDTGHNGLWAMYNNHVDTGAGYLFGSTGNFVEHHFYHLSNGDFRMVYQDGSSADGVIYTATEPTGYLSMRSDAVNPVEYRVNNDLATGVVTSGDSSRSLYLLIGRTGSGFVSPSDDNIRSFLVVNTVVTAQQDADNFASEHAYQTAIGRAAGPGPTSNAPIQAVAYWELEDATDSGSNGLDLSPIGGTVNYEAAKIGSGMLPKVNFVANLMHAHDPLLDCVGTDFTWMFWANLASVSNAQLLHKNVDSSAAGWRLQIVSGKLQFAYPGTVGNELFAESTASLSANTEYHIALTLDSATDEFKYYIDGVLDSTHTIDALVASTEDFGLGGRAAGSGRIANGSWMDQVALFHETLSLAQIQAVYNGGAGVADPTTVL